jgi:hypothetical protein
MEDTTMSGPVEASDVHAAETAWKELATVKVAKRRIRRSDMWFRMFGAGDDGCRHVSQLPDDDPWDAYA